MKIPDKTLVLLYSQASGMAEQSLIKSLEHSNPSNYRRDVLRKIAQKKIYRI